MAQTNIMIEKMSNNRTRSRREYGEINERRERNNKMHKPARISSTSWEGYQPKNIKRSAEHKRVLHHKAAFSYIDF